MNSLVTAYVTLICTSGVLNLYLGAYVFFRRHQYKSIAHIFMIYTASITIYCFAAAATLLSTSLEEIKFWTTILYIGMPASAPLGLMFIMHYLGIKITKKRFIALLIIPFISMIMVATNDFHHLHYRVYEIDPNLGAPFVLQEIGIWYMIHGIYTFASLFVAFLFVLLRWRETAKEYRPQLIALMFGQFVPMLTAFVYLLGLTPPGVDPVPMVLWVSSLLYVWSISSSRLFSIMPIAKDTIFNSINDGVIVLDDFNQMIEFNDASKEMFPKLNKSMFGMTFDQVWLEVTEGSPPLELEHAIASMEVQFVQNGIERIYQIRTSPLQHAHNRKGLLLIFTDITELKKLQLKLEHHAYYDELTQIYNRRAFFEKCEQVFLEAKQSATPFAVMLLDIDFFKNVNDTYGHDVGDQLLKHMVKVCQSQLSEEVLFARYGGEEFVLALKGSAAVASERIAERLRKHTEIQPLETAEGDISVTLSIGLAELVTDETLYQLLKKADKALYDAKRHGRNQVQCWGREPVILSEKG